jgi:hypothetical protein
MNGKLRKLTMSLVLKVFRDFAWTGLKSLKFPDYSILVREEFQQPRRLQNCITPKPFILLSRANNQKGLYNSCIWLQVRFPSERS